MGGERALGARGRTRRGEPWGDLVVLGRDEALAGGAPLPGEVVALLASQDEASGIETARVMLHRAGRPLRVVLAHGCARGGEAPVANALARRLAARVVVLAAAPAFATQDWAARAEAAIEGRRALAFETGAGGGGSPRAAALDRAWASGRLGGPILRADLPGPLAVSEALDAARAEGLLAHDPAAILLDLDPPEDPPAAEVEIVELRDPAALGPGEPGGTVVVLPCIDPERGRAAARRLARRAGAHARIVIAVDAERRGYVATLNAVAGRLAAGRLAYVAEDAYPGPDWLARGLAALDAPGVRLVGFNCGKWDGRIAAFGLMRLDWARRLYGGAVMHAGYRSHRADNEITAIARAQGVYAYDPSALVVERDPLKAQRSRESELPGFDPSDRRLFRRRFRSAFDGSAPRAPLAALAADYLGPGPARSAIAALMEAPVRHRRR